MKAFGEVYQKTNQTDFMILFQSILKVIGLFVALAVASGFQAFFVSNNIATSIVDKMEFSALNKMEKSIDGLMIKSLCLKIEVDRLGIIKKIIR